MEQICRTAINRAGGKDSPFELSAVVKEMEGKVEYRAYSVNAIPQIDTIKRNLRYLIKYTKTHIGNAIRLAAFPAPCYNLFT